MSSKWIPANRIEKGGSTVLPSYQDLGTGQVVWVETQNTTRNIILTAHSNTAPTQYKITVSKPDFAFVTPLQVTTNRTTTGDATNLELTTRAYNSSSQRINIEAGGLEVFCIDPATTGSIPSLKREWSSGESLGPRSTRVITMKTVCEGATLSASNMVKIYVRLYAKRRCGEVQNIIPGTCTPKMSEHTISKTIQWPFRGKTLWHSHSPLIGGVQVSSKHGAPPDYDPNRVYPSRCTLSFPLQLSQSSGRDLHALSTTGHCVDNDATTARGYVWKQGSIPMVSNNSNVRSLGTTHITRPAYSSCSIRTGAETSTSKDNCRKGDHVYALSSPVLGSASIFRPKTENGSTPNNDLDPNFAFFVEHSMNNRFTIVSARPPAAHERVAKVGKSTGWTSVTVFEGYDVSLEDPTCSASRWEEIDNYNEAQNEYFECRALAQYTSRGGDSGAPVFAFQSEGSTNVILVGVHWGKKSTEARFIPIDRIYAESLRQGYDWKPVQIRPVPVLDRTSTPTETRPEKLEKPGDVLKATFEAKDFSRGPGLTYKAALFRNGSRVLDIGEVTTFTDDTVRVKNTSVPVKWAQFDISNLTGTDRTGTLTVAVRACTTEATPKCGGYGSRGRASVTLR